MNKLLYNGLLFSFIALVSGCATYPDKLTPKIHEEVKTVAIIYEITTPKSLDVPPVDNFVADILLSKPDSTLVNTAVTEKRREEWTSRIREHTDFQKLIEETLRESFTEAVRSYPGWTLVSSNELAKADAAFLLEVSTIGFNGYPTKLRQAFSVIVRLIKKPPFEIVGSSGLGRKVIDPEIHPTLYWKYDGTRDRDELPRYSIDEYANSPGVFTTAFQKAIDIVVRRIANSWGP